jgi:hypothetical protein
LLWEVALRVWSVKKTRNAFVNREHSRSSLEMRKRSRRRFLRKSNVKKRSLCSRINNSAHYKKKSIKIGV